VGAFVVDFDVFSAKTGVFSKLMLAGELVNFGLDRVELAKLGAVVEVGISIGDAIKDFLVFFELLRSRMAVF